MHLHHLLLLSHSFAKRRGKEMKGKERSRATKPLHHSDTTIIIFTPFTTAAAAAEVWRASDHHLYVTRRQTVQQSDSINFSIRKDFCWTSREEEQPTTVSVASSLYSVRACVCPPCPSCVTFVFELYCSLDCCCFSTLRSYPNALRDTERKREKTLSSFFLIRGAEVEILEDACSSSSIDVQAPTYCKLTERERRAMDSHPPTHSTVSTLMP